MKLKNKEIAEILGISTTAVSLAINNRPGVSQETRAQVLKLLNDSLNETTSPFPTQKNTASAGGNFKGTMLMSVHKKTGAVINDKPFFSELVEYAQQQAMAMSYLFSIANYLPGQDLGSYMDYIRSMNPSGIIVMATEMDEDDLRAYQSLDLPLVIVDATFDLGDVDTVSLDNQTAIYRAFNYAYGMGHREIGFLKSSFPIQNFEHHMDGFVKGLRQWDLMDGNHPVITLSPYIEQAKADMDRFLDDLPDDFKMPTLFLADLDYLALGAMKSLQDHGYRVPEDVSVIGYDDVPAAAISNPPLTTTRVNHGDSGRIAATVLADIIEKKDRGFRSYTQISSQLVIRESVKNLNLR